MFSYYGENWGAPDTVFRRRVCLFAQSILCADFVFAWLLLGMKVKIGNPFLNFMGKITLEFYLIHGVFVELFDHTFDGGVKSPFPIKIVFFYVIAVFVLGVPSAVLLQKFHHLVLRKNKKPKN
jgi:peptidoglycan/LPS O-acetylase OafA/YrhL